MSHVLKKHTNEQTAIDPSVLQRLLVNGIKAYAHSKSKQCLRNQKKRKDISLQFSVRLLMIIRIAVITIQTFNTILLYPGDYIIKYEKKIAHDNKEQHRYRFTFFVINTKPNILTSSFWPRVSKNLYYLCHLKQNSDQI